MLTRILCVLFCSIALTICSVSDFGLSVGSAVYAGGDGSTASQKSKPTSKTQTTSQPKESDAEKKARIKKGLALVEKLKQHLHSHAKKNGLGDIVSDINELRYLQQNLDKAYALLDGTPERNKPNEVTRMLNKMARSKDAKLKENAKNTRRGIKTHRKLSQAQDVGRAYDQALTSGTPTEQTNLKVQYERAVDAYHAAARSMPVELRHFVFQPLPDIPKGNRPKTFK